MRTAIHETNNPFSTFALRGGRLRKRGRGVVSYAPFLIGVSAIVLGSMFMLSAPPFANASDAHGLNSANTCADSTLSTAVKTKTEITTTVTPDQKHTNAANGQVVTNTVAANDTYHDDNDYDHVDVIVTRAGVYNTTFTTSGLINGADSEYEAGVFVYRKGNGALCLVNNADIRNTENYGIEASRSGEGVLDISNGGNITNAGRIGIKASRAGDHDLKISSTGNIGATRGVYARHTTGGGNIKISLSETASITAGGTSATDHGIEAVHNGSGLVDIDVLSERVRGSGTKNIESTHGTGIHIERGRNVSGRGDGDVAVDVNGSVWGKESGVWVKHNRTGSVTISANNESWIHGDRQHGIYVNHIGGGLVDIDVEGRSSNVREGVTAHTGDAIKVINTGNNLIDIDIDGRVSSTVSSTGSNTSGKGVYAKHDGGGDIDIALQGDGKVLSSDDDGIYAKHTSSGKVLISLRGVSAVSTANTRTGNATTGKHGVNVHHSGSGLVDIDVLSERVRGSGTKNIESTHGTGIHVERTGTGEGEVAVETDGSVWGKESGVWVKQNRTGSVTISANNESWIHGDRQHGIYVNHIGGGLVDIDVEGRSSNVREGVTAHTGDAIKVINTGNNLIDIDIDGRVSSTVSSTGSNTSGKGVYAKHDGGGDIDIALQGDGKVLSSDDDGIYAKHTSSGKVLISLRGVSAVSTANTRTGNATTGKHGVNVHHSGSGLVDIDVLSERVRGSGTKNIESTHGTGIHVERTGTGEGEVAVETDGSVWGKESGVWVKQNRTGSVTISANNESWIHGDRQHGIYVNHIGGGLVDIDIKGESSNVREGVTAHTGDAIKVINTGNNLIDIDIDGKVSSTVFSLAYTSGNAVYAKHDGGGNIEIDLLGDGKVSGTNDDTIHAIHSGGGDIGIDIKNRGEVTSHSSDAIHAEHTSSGDIRIDVRNHGRITSHFDDGIYAKHTNDGDIVISFQGKPIVKTGSIHTPLATNGGHGIEVHHSGSGLVDIDINTQPFGLAPVGFRRYTPRNVYSYRGDGIFIERAASSSGKVNVATNGPVWGHKFGIQIDHKNTGDIKLEVLNGAWVFGQRRNAIRVSNRGGLIDIDIKGNTTEWDGVQSYSDSAIYVSNSSATDSKPIDIDIDGRVLTFNGDGIDARHQGQGNIEITLEGDGRIATVNGEGIDAKQTGRVSGGNVEIDIKDSGKITTHNLCGIRAQSSVGNVGITIEGGGEVRSYNSSGICTQGAEITIDISGTVLNGSDDDDFAISMNSVGTKTLILHPGFVLGGDAFSSGAGKGILRLERHAVNASREGTLNLDTFNDFEEFVKADENVWVVTDDRGKTDEPSSSFKKAKVVAGTLRFSNVNFSMASGRRRFFEVLDDSVLEIIGTNTLKGNLKNSGRGEVVFGSGGNLKVEGNYKGLGGLIFDIEGKNGVWDTQQKLLIEGTVTGGELSRPVFIRYSGSLSLGAGDSPWLVQQKNNVEEGEDHFDIGGVMIGEEIVRDAVSDEGRITIGTNLYEFEHDHVDVQDGTETIGVNGWRLKFISSMADTAPIIPDPNLGANDSRIDRNRRQSLANRRQPIALRGDVRGRAGGVWAEQGSSRTLQESGTISGGRLRTESNRVRFGFDLPTQSFVGGDVVLGAGVRQGFSVSDVSSLSGRSIIGVESHAALLTASWWSPAGFYADGQTRYVRFSRGISVDGFSLGQGHEGTGMGVSTELGYRFAFPFSEMDFEVVPQIQLMWSRVGFEDYVTPSGGLISLEDGELMKGRLGLSWDGEWRDAGGSGHIYGGVNLRDALDGRTAVRATGVLLTNKQISSVDGRLGLSYEWDEGYSVYGEAKVLRSGGVEEASANLGVRVDF